ncbi:hypothetical protein [Niabella drilacis]|uniref:ATP synthase I chain n=1 Tax=Niabella drilacis (strain DSM 25811 / CCM 8410 / CCUG 62505 / LMG 26954 / E90) TaxID=1285928 RepID=A0A1G6SXL3_NIADE|nr:hypothetical protein [Niabella drilacis]SDD21602.1 hypothetical protein SAMN04487894_10712 [Niabella drilacis]
MTQFSAKAAVKTPIRIMIAVFVVISALFIFGKAEFQKNNVDATVVLAGNLLLFLISLLNILRSANAADNPNPHVFVRVFYGGFVIRLFACAIAAFIYIYTQQGRINKPALFICLGIYIIYSLIETTTLKKIFNNKKNNG